MKNFSISRLAEIILAQRKQQHLTQQDLADKAGINRSMLCRLENQEYIPSLDQLTRLANALQFDVADVFIEYNPPVFQRVVPRNITVYGAGYVGLSVATMLARYHHVTLVDVSPEKVEMINHRISPVPDEYIERYFARADLHLTATLDGESACRNAEFVIVAIPDDTAKADPSIASPVEETISTVSKLSPDATIVIMSSVPIGFTASACKKYGTGNILYSPEFLRESRALYDNLYPSRIIVGCDSSVRNRAEIFAEILRTAALKKDIETRIIGLSEAETVTLFSRLFLAVRVSCFNELDTYAELNNLNAHDIIEGICLDPRIGSHYSNPSFGYNEFGLPKTARHLLTDSDSIPYDMLSSVLRSNQARKEFITERILEKAGISIADDCWDYSREKKSTIGVFHLTMENDSPGLGQSIIPWIIRRIKASGASVVIYEPLLEDSTSFLGSKVINDLKKFKKQSDIIIANRYDPCLDNVNEKVYTRDLFRDD